MYRTGKRVDFFSDTDFESIPDARSLAAQYRLIVFPGHEEYVTSHGKREGPHLAGLLHASAIAVGRR